jgi:hypothetical protein
MPSAHPWRVAGRCSFIFGLSPFAAYPFATPAWAWGRVDRCVIARLGEQGEDD